MIFLEPFASLMLSQPKNSIKAFDLLSLIILPTFAFHFGNISIRERMKNNILTIRVADQRSITLSTSFPSWATIPQEGICAANKNIILVSNNNFII